MIVLRRAVNRLLLVVAIALGVMLMHGLVVADHATHGHASTMAMEAAASTASVTTPADAMLAMAVHAGEACLWVLVGGVAVVAMLLARCQPRGDVAEHARSTLRLSRGLPGPAPPGSRSLEMFGVLLR